MVVVLIGGIDHPATCPAATPWPCAYHHWAWPGISLLLHICIPHSLTFEFTHTARAPVYVTGVPLPALPGLPTPTLPAALPSTRHHNPGIPVSCRVMICRWTCRAVSWLMLRAPRSATRWLRWWWTHAHSRWVTFRRFAAHTIFVAVFTFVTAHIPTATRYITFVFAYDIPPDACPLRFPTVNISTLPDIYEAHVVLHCAVTLPWCSTYCTGLVAFVVQSLSRLDVAALLLLFLGYC